MFLPIHQLQLILDASSNTMIGLGFPRYYLASFSVKQDKYRTVSDQSNYGRTKSLSLVSTYSRFQSAEPLTKGSEAVLDITFQLQIQYLVHVMLAVFGVLLKD